MLIALFIVGVAMWIDGWIRERRDRHKDDAYWEERKRKAREYVFSLNKDIDLGEYTVYPEDMDR